MELTALFLGVFGLWLLAKRKQSGFLCWIISNILWITFAINNSHWELLTYFILFLLVTIYGWCKSKPKPIKTNYG